MVRSFSGRLGRIKGQAVVQIRGQIQQGEDLLLQGGEGGEMAQDVLGGVQHGQGDLLEGTQQTLGSGSRGGARGLAGVETGTACPQGSWFCCYLAGAAETGVIVIGDEDIPWIYGR